MTDPLQTLGADASPAARPDDRRWAPPRMSGERLDRIAFREEALTLLAGPAGSGKTMALAALHDRLCRDGTKVVWLSLAAEHNDAGWLPADLASALTSAEVLIIDGLDRLQPAALEQLSQAVTAPEVPGRILLSDARLRGAVLTDHWLRGLLHVIGPEALQLSDADAGRILVPLAGQELPLPDIARINRFCEGWAAGVALLARTPGAVRRILDQKEPALPQVMADWFEHRLCRDWPAARLALLSDLAVLERFTPEVLPLLPVGRMPPDWALITPLLAEGGFLQPEPDGSWFRLQPAFALHLRQRLQRHDPARYQVMRRFAVEWFATGPHIGEALRHAALLPEHRDATRILEAAEAIAVDLGNGPEVARGLQVPPAQAGKLPLVFFGQLYWRIRHGRAREAEMDFQEACRRTSRFSCLLQEHDPVLIRSWVHMFEAVFDVAADRPVSGDLVLRMEESLREARSIQPAVAVALSSILAYLYLDLSRHREAAAVCQIGLAVHQAHPSNKAAIFVRQHQASVALASDSVEKALLYVADADRLAAIEGRSASYEVLTSAVHLAALLYENNEADRAAAILEPVLPQLTAVNGWTRLLDAAFSTLALIRAEQPVEAEKALAAGEALARSRDLPRLQVLLAVTRAQILLRKDPRAAAAVLEADALRDLVACESQDASVLAVQVPLLLAEAGILAGLGRMRDVQAVLDRINRPWLAEADQRLRLAYLVLAMRVAFARRRYNAAIDCLEAAADLARRAGLIRRSLDARGHLLQVLDWAIQHGRPVSAAVRSWIDGTLRPAEGSESGELLLSRAPRHRAEPESLSLSPREAEIMVLIAEGMITKEIARRLGISDGTVKSHRKKIHEKLGVRSRSHAILRARELLLI